MNVKTRASPGCGGDALLVGGSFRADKKCHPMFLLDLSFARPEANLAADEALLNRCEVEPDQEVLRFWTPARPFVVVGYGNRIATEVRLERCQRAEVPVLRRCTGGGTVLQAEGCFNFTLVLSLQNHPAIATIPGANEYIMERQARAMRRLLGSAVRVRGVTDLTLNDFKFSGNAQRRRKSAILFHGSFLLAMDLNLVEEFLPLPTLRPEYRGYRSHLDFLKNIEVPTVEVRRVLSEEWSVHQHFRGELNVEELVVEKYSRAEWNRKF